MPRATAGGVTDMDRVSQVQMLEHDGSVGGDKFPHGMCTTHADVVNPELLAFIAE